MYHRFQGLGFTQASGFRVQGLAFPVKGLRVSRHGRALRTLRIYEDCINSGSPTMIFTAVLWRNPSYKLTVTHLRVVRLLYEKSFCMSCESARMSYSEEIENYVYNPFPHR